MEMTMRKTALTIFGALLISGSMVQMAAAAEHHKHVTKANLARSHYSDFRGAYNQVNGPITNVRVTPAIHDTDYRLPDHSWIGDEDPSLHPSD
jgi:hypothetical protein